MKNVTAHVMGIRLQDLKLMGLEYTNLASTTLNELFGIQSGIDVDAGQYPIMQYMAIGNGGHTSNTAADGLSYPMLKTHGPQDCALINHLPFALRLPSEDFDSGTRSNYAMRGEVTIDGVDYIAYYLRRLDMTNVQVSVELNTVDEGVTTSAPWVPNNSNLHPDGTLPDPFGVTDTEGQYVSVKAILTVTFDDADIDNLIDVAHKLYGNKNLAIISEVGLVAGQSKVVNSSVGAGGTLTYNETVGAILCSSMSAFYHLPSLNDKLSFSFDVGGGESLYCTTND